MDTSPNTELILRDATRDDISVLARHHRNMFEEIWKNNDEQVDSDRFSDMEIQYGRKLQNQLPDGSCKAWVIEDGDNIIASGAISVAAYVPTPDDTDYNVAFLHSMYTERDYRHRRALQIKPFHIAKNEGSREFFLLPVKRDVQFMKKSDFNQLQK